MSKKEVNLREEVRGAFEEVSARLDFLEALHPSSSAPPSAPPLCPITMSAAKVAGSLDRRRFEEGGLEMAQ